MGLGPPHDDPVGVLADDVEVEVGIRLLVRRLGAVALHVGLGDRDHEVVLRAAPVERLRPLELHTGERREQAEHRVGAHILDREDRPAQQRADLDQLRPARQVVGGARHRVERVVLARNRVVAHDRERAVRVVVRHVEVDARVVDRDAEIGLRADVVDPLALVPEHPAVSEGLPVLVSGPQTHVCSPVARGQALIGPNVATASRLRPPVGGGGA